MVLMNQDETTNTADDSVSPTPQFPSTMQITVFELSEADFFHVLCNENLLQTMKCIL